MNIFVVDADPATAARSLCDKHIVKMILESAQMLCSAFEVGAAPYKRAHFSHPCTIWCRSTTQNYEWLLEHGFAMCEEYTERYNKVHKTQAVLQWLKENKPELPNTGLTVFPQAMPDQYKGPDSIAAYRRYYIFEKSKFAVWKDNSKIPLWYLDGCKQAGITVKGITNGIGHVCVSTESGNA